MVVLVVTQTPTSVSVQHATTIDKCTHKALVTMGASRTLTHSSGRLRRVSFKRVYLHSCSTETTASYCNTITFFSGIIDYFCASLSISTPQQLYTTYLGQTDAKTWQQLVITPSDSATGGSFPSSDTGIDFSVSPTPSSSFTDSATNSPTNSPTGSTGGGNGNNSGNGNGNGNNGNGNGNGSGSDSDNGSNGSSNTAKSSTPVGPIVGGVVGGVGGLALIGLGIFFLLRHNKQKKAANPEQPMKQTAAVDGTAPPPPGAPGYPPQGHNNGPYGQPPYQGQTPPPQAYYPSPEQKTTGFVTMAPAGVPDRNDSTSPVSQFTDPRHSTQPHSPTSTLNSNWGPQPPQPLSPNVPPTVYEAGGNVVGERDYNSNHHGQFHEMA